MGTLINIAQQGKNLFYRSKQVIYASLLIAAVSACGGGGGGSSAGSDSGNQTIGTRFTGKAATGSSLANADIRIKSASGRAVNTQTNNNGDFSSSELTEPTTNTADRAYLLSMQQNDGSFLYSVAHQQNATFVDDDSQSVTINIHPFTDLMVRNWFAQQYPGQDIDTLMAGNQAINLPSADEITQISNEFLTLLNEALKANNIANVDSFNWLSDPFETNTTGFNQFLQNSQIIIINNMINLYITQPGVDSPVHSIVINNVDLSTDFTDITQNSAPSMPENVRVLPSDVAGEAIVIWQPSSDDKGVAYYRIYRDGVQQATSPYPVFIDQRLAAGTTYEYTIEAVDGQAASSGQTASTSIRLSTPDTTNPEPVATITATGSNGVIQLNWQLGMIEYIDDIAGFQVLRGLSGNVNRSIAHVTSTYFTDTTVAPGVTYCYQIVAYDGAGNTSSPSSEACVNAGGLTFESTVSFSSDNYRVNENAGLTTISVNRSGDISKAISVEYAAVSGSATEGSDFASARGTLRWEALDRSPKTFTIQLAADNNREGNETINLRLSNPSADLINGYDSATLSLIDTPVVDCVNLVPVNILSNTTLSQPCYNINSNVTVTGNTRLTINPGVRLQFAEGTRLFIDESATLIANGTANAPIIFTGQLAVPGFWGGLDMTSRAESQISFAILEYGGGSNTLSNSNIHFYFDGRLSLSNSIIRHSSGYGLQQSNGGLLTRFSGNTIALNEQAPVSIAIDSLDLLSADNVYSGNVTVVGGNRDYIEVRPGTVTTNQIWPALDVDYRMPAGTTNIDAALTLAPGARLVFPSEALLNINSVGTLRALGSLASPVHFTSVPGTNWAGIQFTFNNNNNIIDHAIIENGGGYASNTQANVGIYGSTSRLTLSNTVLRGSASYGFQFITDNLNLNMRNVTVTGNALTGQIAFDQVGSLDSGSTYTGNASDYIDLWGTAVNSNQTVKNIGVPYYIGYGYLSSVNAALIIEPGVSIVFNSGGGLSVTASGTLIADGTPEAPITFTGNQKISGYWDGIEFVYSSNANIIDNTIIEYGGSVSGYTDALIGSFGPAALPNQVRITNNILRDSANHAIEVSAGTIVNGDLGTNHFENIAGQNIRINR